MRYIIILCMLMISSIVYAESNIGEENPRRHGPGWKSANCNNIIDPDQAVVCNMMGLELLVIEAYGWEVWEFDDSYIILHDEQETFLWDCIIDHDTDKANLFFCEVMMGYNYESSKSYDLTSDINNISN